MASLVSTENLYEISLPLQLNWIFSRKITPRSQYSELSYIFNPVLTENFTQTPRTYILPNVLPLPYFENPLSCTGRYRIKIYFYIGDAYIKIILREYQ